MKSSLSRYVASAALLAGVALIVWTAVGDPDTEPALTETASTSTSAPEAPAVAEPDIAPPTTTGSDGAVSLATTEALEPIPVLGTAFTLNRLDGWLNTDATSLEEIRDANKITVVQFWTFGCRNCKNTLDALGELYADFGDEGVEIVGVHSPEFAYEADVDNIIEAAAALGVTWPIALDTTKYNFHVWQEGPTGYWPRVYVIDSDNQIRFDRRGDSPRKYDELHEIVGRLLAEA